MGAGHGAELWPDPQSPFTFAATAILQLQSDRTFGTQHSVHYHCSGGSSGSGSSSSSGGIYVCVYVCM